MKFVLLVLFVIAFSFSSSSFAYFQGSGSGFGKPAASTKNNTKLRIKSAQQAAQVAKNHFGGKVLKVNKKNSNSSPVYRVKLVKTNGHVISVIVDAKTGQIIGN